MTYIPTTADIEWTRKAIEGKRAWTVPSAGSVLEFDHSTMVFTTFMKMDPNPPEIDLFERVCLNLAALGFREEKRIMCEGADTVDDILVNVFGLTEDDIEANKIYSSRNRPHDPRFDD